MAFLFHNSRRYYHDVVYLTHSDATHIFAIKYGSRVEITQHWVFALTAFILYICFDLFTVCLIETSCQLSIYYENDTCINQFVVHIPIKVINIWRQRPGNVLIWILVAI